MLGSFLLRLLVHTVPSSWNARPQSFPSFKTLLMSELFHGTFLATYPKSFFGAPMTFFVFISPGFYILHGMILQ